MAEPTYQRIYKVVRRIPKGRVATYGQVARLAGLGAGARQVGYALHALREAEQERVPWQRVINARGEISLRRTEGADETQRRILEDEGVLFDLRGRIDLTRYQWRRGRER